MTWVFKLSVEKSQTVFFTGKKIDDDVCLKLFNQRLGRVKTFKFLGLWFDCVLIWGSHINKMEDKCKQKVLNVMRCPSGTVWGADQMALKNIYIALIRSVFDCGCIVFGSAASTSSKMSDRIQAQVLRLC